MGPWGRGRRNRFLVALLAPLAVTGLTTPARGDTPATVGSGPVTDLVVRGDTVEVTALPARARVVF